MNAKSRAFGSGLASICCFCLFTVLLTGRAGTLETVAAPATATQTVVLPDGASSNFGDTSFDPFFFTELEPVTQVYDPAAFIKSGINGAVLIRSVSFRLQENLSSSIDVVVPQVKFTFGTSPGAFGDYAPDRVADRTTVYQQNDVHLIAQRPKSPSDFNLVFTLSTPYVYDPNKGSLEFMISSHAPFGKGASMDAQYSGGGALYYYEPGIRPVVVSEVIVTKFGLTPIPEPSAVALILLFCGLYACLGLKLPLNSARRFDAHFESLPGVRSPVSDAQRIPHHPNCVSP